MLVLMNLFGGNNGDTDVKIGLVDGRGEKGEGGMYGSDMQTCMLPCGKQILGNSNQAL